MKYTPINQKHIDFFIKKLGEKNILVGDACNNYGSDETENLNYPPELVLFQAQQKKFHKFFIIVIIIILQ